MHCPAAPEGVGRDRQSRGPAGVAGLDGSHVAGQEFGRPGACQPGVVRPVEQRARVGAEAGVRVTVFQVVGDGPGGLVHHGHVSDFGSLPADRAVIGVERRMSATLRSQSSWTRAAVS